MELIQFDLTGRGQPDIAETVYDSLQGFLLPACSLPWVETVFCPGHPSHDHYEQMLDIKEQLAEVYEERDLEAMVDHVLAYSKAIALEMFRYGRIFQKQLDEK